MQRFFFKIIILLLALKTSFNYSQNNNSSGVFLTAADFKRNKISYTRENGIKYRFLSNRLFHSDIIKIKIGDSTYKINKNAIYGYQTRYQVRYRIYCREEYEVLNPDETILLYKKTFFQGSKANQYTKFYFSISYDSDIFPLTKFNLKLKTPNDSIFHEKIDMYFNNDEDLLNYDFYYKSYKLNRIYNPIKH